MSNSSVIYNWIITWIRFATHCTPRADTRSFIVNYLFSLSDAVSQTCLILYLWHLDYEDQPLDKPLKLVLKVGGSEVTELSGSGHDSSYYDDRSDHERERHKEKKKKKKKKSEKEKDKHLDDDERRRRKVRKGAALSFFILSTC